MMREGTMGQAHSTVGELPGTSVAGADAPLDGDIELVGRRVVGHPGGAVSASWPGAPGVAARLRSTLRDEIAVFLLGALLLAQVADLVTTHIALSGHGLMERNPLFRPLFASLPGVADAVKLGAVFFIAALAMVALPLRQSRHALLLAAGLSIVAPIASLMLLAGRM